eukprot:14957876-Alexandrium_andersonii.AAC.1
MRLASCAVGKAKSTRAPSARARRMQALTTVVLPAPGLPKPIKGLFSFQAASRASSAASWSSP